RLLRRRGWGRRRWRRRRRLRGDLWGRRCGLVLGFGGGLLVLGCVRNRRHQAVVGGPYSRQKCRGSGPPPNHYPRSVVQAKQNLQARRLGGEGIRLLADNRRAPQLGTNRERSRLETGAQASVKLISEQVVLRSAARETRAHRGAPHDRG